MRCQMCTNSIQVFPINQTYAATASTAGLVLCGDSNFCWVSVESVDGFRTEHYVLLLLLKI